MEPDISMTTERLIIRAFQEADLEAFAAYHNDAAWMQYQTFKCLTIDQYREELLTKRDLTRGVQLAFASKESNQLIGDLYVLYDDPAYIIGYSISPEYQRQGYTAEAVKGLCDYLKAQGANLIKAETDSRNTASIALLEKLGFQFYDTFFYIEF